MQHGKACAINCMFKFIVMYRLLDVGGLARAFPTSIKHGANKSLKKCIYKMVELVEL